MDVKYGYIGGGEEEEDEEEAQIVHARKLTFYIGSSFKVTTSE